MIDKEACIPQTSNSNDAILTNGVNGHANKTNGQTKVVTTLQRQQQKQQPNGKGSDSAAAADGGAGAGAGAGAMDVDEEL